MTIHFGNVPAGSVLYIPFTSYNSAGASVTLTGLAVTDIEIYKNGSTTQRASDNGYTLLDTDGIDFDGITGLHGFSIDLSDNSDSGFYAAGAQYWVVVSTVTIDGQTVTLLACTFRIQDDPPTAAAIADAVWDEDLTGHTTTDSAGQLVADTAVTVSSLVSSFNGIPQGVWEYGVDGAVTAEQSMRLQNSALGGKLSGAGTGTETVRDLADTKDRLVYTVDDNGNRTAVTRDLT